MKGGKNERKKELVRKKRIKYVSECMSCLQRGRKKLKTWLERFSFIWTPHISACLMMISFYSRLNAFFAEKRVSLEEKSYSITTPTATFIGLNSRLNPWGFHLVNVMIHALVVQMIILLARYELNCGNHLTLMTSLFFATHPIHTEAVSSYETFVLSLFSEILFTP